MNAPRLSVVMPTYGHRAFIARAISSAIEQRFEDWELLVVDDASPDGTAAVVETFDDPRIRYLRLPGNVGMGAAINRGLDLARADLVAYLPSDDVWYADHLERLVALLEDRPDALVAVSGARHQYNRFSLGAVDGHGIQPVQVLHRRTQDRWLERHELVTDDLDRMFWRRLLRGGAPVETGRVTCEWVEHPGQRHRLLTEPEGGIATYRARFGIAEPLRFQTRNGNAIDEPALYAPFRDRAAPVVDGGLRILIVGELAYSPERILALEERGHRLYGLWMPDPYWYNTVGPLPFGHVEEVPRAGWQEAVREIRPDVIYALLNWQAVPFAHHVLSENPGIPFVWHFKEGPFICLEKGTWNELVDLYLRSDGQIYISPEHRDWTNTAVPGTASSPNQLVLDGDLPKREWFADLPAAGRQWPEGEVHTVVSGRPIGLHPESVAELAGRNVHLHFYGDFTHGQWRNWIERAEALAPDHLHLHPHVDQRAWVSEFSRYDAAWLHVFESRNGGDIRRADWDDLNYPARLPTYLAAGLPVIYRDNTGSAVATQALCDGLGFGLPFRTFDELAARLHDPSRLASAGACARASREQFTFDHHVGELEAFLRRVAAQR